MRRFRFKVAVEYYGFIDAVIVFEENQKKQSNF